MKNKVLYIMWGLMYLLCAFMGLIVPRSSGQAAAMTVLSVVFFLPPLLLLLHAWRHQQKQVVSTLRWLSIASLGATLLVLLLNILSVNASETVGQLLYGVLVFVSSPMVCSQHYALSLFLWACLLFATAPGILFRKK